MNESNLVRSGAPLRPDSNVLIMIHGRGAAADDILSLAPYLPVSGFSLLAPQSPSRTWYPHSFMAPVAQNQPYLDASLKMIGQTVAAVLDAGIQPEKIWLLGFSQGACLALEFAARNARRYGGVVGFTGGLIGQVLDKNRYSGDLQGTPVFLGSGDPDPHVPATRVRESADQLVAMNATVQVKIFPGRPHTVTEEEMTLAATHVFGSSPRT